MSTLPIYLYGTEVLRKKAKPIQKLDDAAIKLMYDLAETMRKANGIGLAATQVGELRRMLVVDVSAIERGAKEEDEGTPPQTEHESRVLVMINPEIKAVEGSVTMEEGCLSIPDIREEVNRAEKIRVRYLDTGFNVQELSAEGLLGRVMLHEIDHLNGVLFLDHLGAVKRKLLRGRLNKLERGEVDVDYPIVGNSQPATGTDPR